MEEKRKSEKAPLIYAIVGVAVLIVAIAGSTFAYFTASAAAEGAISGETLSIDLGIDVTPISDTGEKGEGLIPIHDGTVDNVETGSKYPSQLQAAATANCVDSQRYTVCQIYEITLTNDGTDEIAVNTSVEFTEETLTKFENLKWARMTAASTVGTGTFAATTSAANINEAPVTLGADEIKQYIMVYVMNTGGNQTSIDSGAFSGTIRVTASTGANVEAKF